MERLAPIVAARLDLLLAVSPADDVIGKETTGPWREARDRHLAADHDADTVAAADAWFAALGDSLL